MLESWKGDLKKGERLSVPALVAFAPEKERLVSIGLFGRDKDEELPAAVTCTRMALFLVRKQEKPEGDKPSKTSWLPTAGERGGVKVSTAWIEAGRVFVFVQPTNPGPQQLLSRDTDERGLKKEVGTVLMAQTALTEQSGVETRRS